MDSGSPRLYTGFCVGPRRGAESKDPPGFHSLNPIHGSFLQGTPKSLYSMGSTVATADIQTVCDRQEGAGERYSEEGNGLKASSVRARSGS